MGDGFGFRPRIRLMDTHLRLDPDIERRMAEIEAEMTARRSIHEWLRPNFQLLLPQWQSILSAPPNPLTTPLPSPAPGGYTPGAGPDTARTAGVGDLVGAVYQLPAVQRLVTQAHDEGLRQLRVLRSEWDQAGTGERATMITFSTLVVGGMLTSVLANQPSRDAALGLLNGRAIPIPGVGGLSMTLTYQPAAGSQPGNYGVTVGLDVMQLIRR